MTRQTEQIKDLIMDLKEESRSLSLFNAYYDAYLMNGSQVLTNPARDHVKYVDGLLEIFKKYYLIIQRIP